MANVTQKMLPVNVEKEVLKAFYNQHPYIRVNTIRLKMNNSPISNLSQLGVNKVEVGALEVTTQGDLVLIFPVFILDGDLQPLDVAATNKTEGYWPINKTTYANLDNSLGVGTPVKNVSPSEGKPIIDKQTGLPAGVQTTSNNMRGIYSFRAANIMKTASAVLMPKTGQWEFSLTKNKEWLQNKIMKIAQKGELYSMITKKAANPTPQNKVPGVLVIEDVSSYFGIYKLTLYENTLQGNTQTLYRKQTVTIYSDDSLEKEIRTLIGMPSGDCDVCNIAYQAVQETRKKLLQADELYRKYPIVIPVNPIRYATTATIVPTGNTKQASAETVGRYNVLNGEEMNVKTASELPAEFTIDPIGEKDLLAKNVPVYLMKVAEDGSILLSQPLVPWEGTDGKYVLLDQISMTPIRFKYASGLKKNAAIDTSTHKVVYIGDKEVLVRLLPGVKQSQTPDFVLEWNSMIPSVVHVTNGKSIACGSLSGNGSINLPPLVNTDELSSMGQASQSLAIILGYYGITSLNVISDIDNRLKTTGTVGIAVSMVAKGV